MTTILNSLGKWPFPAVTDARKEGRDEWVEIDEAHRDEFMNVPPPIYLRPPLCGFMVSEAAAHAPDGEPIYAAVISVGISVGKRYFMRELPKSKLADAVRDLRAALT